MRTVAAAALLLSACVDMPETHKPPQQRKPFLAPDAAGLQHFVSMTSEVAEAHFLRDIREPQDGFRWTGQHPAFRVALPKTTGLRLVAEFGIPELVFEKTGPITITFGINTQVFAKETYAKPGTYTFDRPVAPSFLRPGDNIVFLDLDKVYLTDDNTPLGVTLVRAGFLD